METKNRGTGQRIQGPIEFADLDLFDAVRSPAVERIAFDLLDDSQARF